MKRSSREEGEEVRMRETPSGRGTNGSIGRNRFDDRRSRSDYVFENRRLREGGYAIVTRVPRGKSYNVTIGPNHTLMSLVRHLYEKEARSFMPTRMIIERGIGKGRGDPNHETDGNDGAEMILSILFDMDIFVKPIRKLRETDLWSMMMMDGNTGFARLEGIPVRPSFREMLHDGPPELTAGDMEEAFLHLVRLHEAGDPSMKGMLEGIEGNVMSGDIFFQPNHARILRECISEMHEEGRQCGGGGGGEGILDHCDLVTRFDPTCKAVLSSRSVSSRLSSSPRDDPSFGSAIALCLMIYVTLRGLLHMRTNDLLPRDRTGESSGGPEERVIGGFESTFALEKDDTKDHVMIMITDSTQPGDHTRGDESASDDEVEEKEKEKEKEKEDEKEGSPFNHVEVVPFLEDGTSLRWDTRDLGSIGSASSILLSKVHPEFHDFNTCQDRDMEGEINSDTNPNPNTNPDPDPDPDPDLDPNPDTDMDSSKMKEDRKDNIECISCYEEVRDGDLLHEYGCEAKHRIVCASCWETMIRKVYGDRCLLCDV